MTSYDYRSVEEDFAWIEEDGTDSFQEKFGESTKPIRQLIERTRATATGKVSDAAGNAEDAEHVEVLLFVDQQLQRSGPRVQPRQPEQPPDEHEVLHASESLVDRGVLAGETDE